MWRAVAVLVPLLLWLGFSSGHEPPAAQSFYDLTARDIDGQMVDFAQYRGLVLLVTNVASRCDFTDQHYRLYNRWYKEYHYQGFEILAFPCNQFKNQEPGTDEEVKKFCEENYGVTYPLFSKIDVNGGNTHPVYRYLKSVTDGKDISWNFVDKFIVSRTGDVRKFGRDDNEQTIEQYLKQLLAEPEQVTTAEL